jgi:hypothetical protein
MNESKRVREARAADRTELRSVVNRIVRSPEDRAAWAIARYEAETGNDATPEDWAEARRAEGIVSRPPAPQRVEDSNG